MDNKQFAFECSTNTSKY